MGNYKRWILIDDDTYAAGYHDYENGVEFTDNPHEAGSDKAKRWADGWKAAEQGHKR